MALTSSARSKSRSKSLDCPVKPGNDEREVKNKKHGGQNHKHGLRIVVRNDEREVKSEKRKGAKESAGSETSMGRWGDIARNEDARSEVARSESAKRASGVGSLTVERETV